MKVFLGGTVANSTWREHIMPKLEVEYFNPVVEEWTEEDQKKEIYEREHCDFCLYVLSPKMIGWYSLAEVTDDSYKKSDKTIFCYLPEDEDKKFTEEQISELEKLGKLVRSNGAIWKHNLEEVISFLNSANSLSNDALLQQTDQINSAFISYGRRHSLAFARKLYKNLTDRGYDVWFDMNDIPLGVDFQDQIDDGIRKADNFIYVMSPHAINSVYCYKELVLALKYNKRIIPILHVEPQDDATWGKIDPEAGKRNWIYMRQNHDTALELSAKTFEIKEKILEIPEKQWKMTDDFTVPFENLITLIDSHRAYVRTHTILLDNSLDWLKNSRNTQQLLVGKKRQEAEHFLERSHQIFKNHTGHIIAPPRLFTSIMLFSYVFCFLFFVKY